MSSEWKVKRFWSEVAVIPEDGGFAVRLDGRGVKTPAKATLVLPTQKMADAVAAEWEAQSGEVDPTTMPFTRTANAAIDKVRHQHGEVADMLAAYGDADLLCYRADQPEALVRRQADEWDPALNWASETFGINLGVWSGVVHHSQNPDDLARLSARVHAMSAFHLAGFHDLVSLSGSLILGFAAAMDWRGADEIWAISRLDERWQEEQWGPDDEASAMAEIKRKAFVHAKSVYDYC